MSDYVIGYEFVCVECKREIVRIVGHRNDPDLCSACLFLPGWWRDPELRKRMDPDHDGEGV
jgi:hypothetical protein